MIWKFVSYMKNLDGATHNELLNLYKVIILAIFLLRKLAPRRAFSHVAYTLRASIAETIVLTSSLTT